MVEKYNAEVKIAEILKDIKQIRKLLEGNGKAGLVDHVEANTEFRLKYEGSSNTKNNLFGNGWLVAIILVLLQAAMNYL